MKKVLLLMGIILCSFFNSYSQECQNYSFYLVDNHIHNDGTRSSEIYNVLLDEGTQTANLTEIYSLGKTVHIGFDQETQFLYAVCSQTGGVFAFDVSLLAPPVQIGTMSSGFGFVEMVYDGEGGLLLANEETDEVYHYDIDSGAETFLMSAPVHGGDLCITESGSTLMFTRENGGQILDLDNAQDVIGTTPDWTTGAALMNNGQILVSVRFENQMEVFNDDGTWAGSYAVMKDGLPFELDNGDLTAGCNDPNDDIIPCEVECAVVDGQVQFGGIDDCEYESLSANILLSCGEEIAVEPGQEVTLYCDEPSITPLSTGYSEEGRYLFALSGKHKKHFWRYNANGDNWASMADAPSDVKHGGALVSVEDNYLYAFKGDKKKDFWRYDIGSDTWSDMADAPGNVKDGGALVHDGGNYIYAFKGDKKKDFWRYDIAGDNWSDMADAPGDVKYGGSLAHDGGNFIYAFKGDKKKDFWRYDIAGDSWSDMSDAPDKVKDGGALAYDGANSIYALRGDDKKEFWIYNIPSNSWTDLADAPDKVKQGGALAFDGDNTIYALRGADKKDSWKYDIANNSWTELDEAIDKIKEGGAMAYVGQVLNGDESEDCDYEYIDGVLVINGGSAQLQVTLVDMAGNVSTCTSDIDCTVPEIPCGDCDGQITELSLAFLGSETDATIDIYEGSVNPDKLFASFTGVNTGDIMSFVGSKNHGKMGAKIFLTVNGSNPIEIHTSCSQPIGIGSTYGGLYEVTAGASHEGGPLCDSPDTPDEPGDECGDCDGQITELSLAFLGSETDATIDIYEGSVNPNKLFASFTGINTGDIMSFVGSKNHGKMGAKIFLTVNGSNPIEIHTSCSQPIGIGSTYGGLYEVTAGASHEGGPLCDSPDTPDEPGEDCGDCDGQMTSLDIEFIGSDLDAVVKIYEGKFQDDKLFAEFSGVNNGDVMSFVGVKNHGKMGAKIFLSVNDGAPVEIHTSCSQPIGVGFEYGGLYRIVAGVSHDGGPLCGSVEPECGPCDGQISNLTLEYFGGESGVPIEVFKESIAPENLMSYFNFASSGDNLTIQGTNPGNLMGSQIYLVVNGDDENAFEITTDCSQAIHLYSVFGQFLVISGESSLGGPLCVGPPSIVGNSSEERENESSTLIGQLDTYPNPTTGNLVVEFEPLTTDQTMIEMYNMQGQMVRSVYSGVIEDGVQFRKQIDIRNLENGIYILRVNNSEASEVRKVILTD